MRIKIRYYSPENESVSGGASASQHAKDAPQGMDVTREDANDDAERLTSTRTEMKEDGGDQANVRGGDSTILGAGGLAGGLSGDGERTDEYDAAVMGLDD